jgi:hypothetical protein
VAEGLSTTLEQMKFLEDARRTVFHLRETRRPRDAA